MAEATHGSNTPKRRPRRRIAKGPPRPQYLESRDLDRVFIMFVAHISEVMALRERLDAVETLLERDGKVTAKAIEEYTPSPEKEEQLEAARLASMRRIFRVLRDEFEDYTDDVDA